MIHKPKVNNSPILLASPHSGREYDKHFLDKLNFKLKEIRVFEDSYIDELFDFAPEIGCKLLTLNIPRAIIDVNRDILEIDEEMFFNFKDFDSNKTERVQSGIGLFPKLRGTVEIYKDKQDWLIYKKLIEIIYNDWHKRLEREIHDINLSFSEILYIDCHSMPSLDLNGDKIGKSLPEFVIGNLWGKSCNPEVTNFIIDYLSNEGFNVAENYPYAGAFALQKYGNPKKGINAIQIEIRRDLYLNEDKFILNNNYKEVKRTMKILIESLKDFLLVKNKFLRSAE